MFFSDYKDGPAVEAVGEVESTVFYEDQSVFEGHRTDGCPTNDSRCDTSVVVCPDDNQSDLSV